MKKIALLLTVVLFSTVFYSQESITITREYKRLFNKRNISSISENLTERGWIYYKTSSLYDFLNNTPSVDFDLWVNEEFKEKIYIFYSSGNKEKALNQFNYILDNLLNKDIDSSFYIHKMYLLSAQKTEEYSSLYFIIRS